jgi:GNAT superfamily N-acetyltransferase
MIPILTSTDYYGLRVRPTSSYAAELLELLEYEYIGMYGEPDPDPDGGIEGLEGAHGAVIIMLNRESRPVAMCGVRIVAGDTAILKRVFVRWDHRGKGLSKGLLAAAEDQARRLGATRMHLETGVTQTVARALYSKMGYRPVTPFGFYADQSTSVFLGKAL